MLDKYLDLFISGDTLANLKTALLQKYDTLSLDKTSLPQSVKRDVNVLKDNIRVHLANVDVEAMKTNTSYQIIKLFDGELDTPFGIPCQ